ncbi:hypothetical protein ACFQMG_04515 [Kitasatospora paranensis]|uniref:Integral membrane protein n=1 Tax=Kitasatospora paranensis TaxID=258053 RepID=A0ABW2FNH2_9ACTN
MTAQTVAPFAGAAAPVDGSAAAAWDLRAARAVPFALVCTLIAAAGHALTGGGAVALPALAAGFAAVVLAAAALGGRERSLGAIAGALVSGQLGLHILFHTLAPTSLHQGMAGMAGMSMPAAAGRLLCDDVPGNGPTALPAGTTPEQLISAAGLDPAAFSAAGTGHGVGLLGMSPAMLLGHLAAAAVAGWWLRRGEAALWRLVRLTAVGARAWAAPLRTALGLLTALLLGSAVPAAPRPPRGRATDWRLPAAAVLRHSVVRRGPPAGLAAH